MILACTASFLFHFAASGRTVNVAATLLILMLLYSPILAAGPLASAMQFSPAVRGTGFSLGFNIAATLFGGMMSRPPANAQKQPRLEAYEFGNQA